jgi:putative ABC transport system permease protein
MNTISLAMRNLWRNRRRSITTLSAMSIGLVAILLFGGYRSNIVFGMQTASVQRSGQLQIQRQGYLLNGIDNPTAYGIAKYQQIMVMLKQDPVLAPMLLVVTPTLKVGGVAENFSSGTSHSVVALGVNVPEFNKMASWNDYNLRSFEKPLPLEGTKENAVITGTGLARRLGFCQTFNLSDCDPVVEDEAQGSQQEPADITALANLVKASPALERQTREGQTRIDMLAATAHGAPNVASLDVIGTRNMGVKALDDIYLFMHLSQAQRLVYGAGAPEVTSIDIQLRHNDQIPVAQARVAQLLKQYFGDEKLTVMNFIQINPMYTQSMQFMNSMFGFIAVLIGVIVLFTVSNTMSTAIVERTVEIGTLRAMGLRRSGIRRLFLCEGILLGLLGAIIGILIALLIAWLINTSGWRWTPPGYSYAFLVLVRVAQDANLLISSLVGLVALSIFSSWWPARRAARQRIVDALRHV